MAIGIRHPNKELWIFFNYAKRCCTVSHRTRYSPGSVEASLSG